MTTNAENLVKIGPVLAELFGKICHFFPVFLAHRRKRYHLSPCNLWDYCRKVHQIFTQCSQIIAMLPF